MKACHWVIACAFIFNSSSGVAQAVYFDKTFNVGNNQEVGWSVLILPDSSYITLSNGADFFSGDGSYSLSFFSFEGNIVDNKIYKTNFSFPYVGFCNTLLTLPDSNGYIFAGSI